MTARSHIMCQTFKKTIRFELRPTPADANIFIFNIFLDKIIDMYPHQILSY